VQLSPHQSRVCFLYQKYGYVPPLGSIGPLSFCSTCIFERYFFGRVCWWYVSCVPKKRKTVCSVACLIIRRSLFVVSLVEESELASSFLIFHGCFFGNWKPMSMLFVVFLSFFSLLLFSLVYSDGRCYSLQKSPCQQGLCPPTGATDNVNCRCLCCICNL